MRRKSGKKKMIIIFFFLFLQLESERKKTVTVTLEPEARNDELIRDISFYFSGSRRVRTYIIETMESL